MNRILKLFLVKTYFLIKYKVIKIKKQTRKKWNPFFVQKLFIQNLKCGFEQNFFLALAQSSEQERIKKRKKKKEKERKRKNKKEKERKIKNKKEKERKKELSELKNFEKPFSRQNIQGKKMFLL